MHIKRVNYQFTVLKPSHVQNPEKQSSQEHGWTMVNSKLEPQWVDGDILPTYLINIIDEDDVSVTSLMKKTSKLKICRTNQVQHQ